MRFRASVFWVALAVLGLWAVTASGERVSILLYTSVPIEIMTKIEETFEAVNPDIDLVVFRTGTGKLKAKIATECEVGKIEADLIWVADFTYYETLKEMRCGTLVGQLLYYKPPAAAAIPAELYDKEGYYYGARIINMVIAYNTTLVQEPPRKWKDLLDEKWKDQIIMGNVLYSGALVDTMGALVMRYGLEYFEKLRENGAVVVRSNTGAAKAIAAGEYPVGITLDYIVRNLKAKGSPIDLVYPQDGPVVIPSPIAIVASTDQPEAAKRFVDYLLSKEGQETLVKLGNFVSVIPEVSPPPGAPALEELMEMAMPLDWDWIRRNMEWLNEQWTRIMLD
ncbi:MAG TPA: extracellular solute-binding protein [Desulfobacterales bacterium]|nr:extracellular solute-binding protein [Desulfobacterales bacterium]